MVLDVRTLPFQNDNDVEQELKKFSQKYQPSFEIDYMEKPNSSPFETDLLKQSKNHRLLV
ncbi:MAG: hypothetical protein Ct9H90mP2_10820 [Dehalococcoidia bacterium]|nr:MAG: hypothetical protein Ct9H90mP2_10820 [Dehalococcoidia bacterium]